MTKTRATAEEMQALRGQGLSNLAIAKELGVAPTTVKKHIGDTPPDIRLNKRRECIEKARTAKLGRTRGTAANRVEEMQTLRAQNKSNAEIARALGLSPMTVSTYIGPTPNDIKQKANAARVERMNAAKKAKREAAQTPANAPETPPAAPVAVNPPTPPAPARKPINPAAVPLTVPTKLFDFAYCYRWTDQLQNLADLAQPEPWDYPDPDPGMGDYPLSILDWYVKGYFTELAHAYNNAGGVDEKQKIIATTGGVCCFNTGLQTPLYKAIFAIFIPSKSTASKWFLFGFYESDALRLRSFPVLPLPLTSVLSGIEPFRPEREIEINTVHILGDEKNRLRLPESIREAWNLPLLIEAAVLMARRRVATDPGLIARTLGVYSKRYFLPLYLTNPDVPDLVACVEDWGARYKCATLLTKQMAYGLAREYGRPGPQWLRDVVEKD